MIPFNNFPSDLLVPLVGVEFDTSRLASGFTPERKILAIGQRLAVGTVAAGLLTPCTNGDLADNYFGRASMLADIIRTAKANAPYADIYALALDEDAAGNAAAGAVLFGGPATAAGTISSLIGGIKVKVGCAVGKTGAQTATAYAAAVNAIATMKVTAAVDGVVPEKVNLTCKWKGETGNDIDIRFNYYRGEFLPVGITAAVTAMTGGTANPDLADAIAVFADERWDTIICPYTDAANLTLLEAELANRWNNLRVKAGLAYVAFRANHTDTGTFGNTRNSALVSCMPTNIAPQPPWVWAAADAGQCHAALGNDPARQLKTLPLIGILPPAQSLRWDDAERNLHLHDGISSFTVDAGGIVRIDRQVTMYQTNASGVIDRGLLDVTTPATMIYLGLDLASYFTSKYPRHKLADDGTEYGEGQPITTPKLLSAEFYMKALEWQEKGLVEKLEQYKADLIVERDPDNRNRVNALIPPDLVNNLMQLAILVQPRL